MARQITTFTTEGRQKLATLLQERLNELGLSVTQAVEWIEQNLQDKEDAVSHRALHSILKCTNQPTWNTLAVLAATVFRGCYTVFDLAEIACGQEPKKPLVGESTGSVSPT